MEKVILKSLCRNVIETIESTANITLIISFLRNKLIDLKRQQEYLIRQQSSNDFVYLNAMNNVTQLGFARFALFHYQLMI